VFTVVVVQFRAGRDGTAVRVEAYREREGSRDINVRVPMTATLTEVGWCETVAEKLEKALREEEGGLRDSGRTG
jgi:hypothetical protein